jgi:hypothetical protein
VSAPHPARWSAAGVALVSFVQFGRDGCTGVEVEHTRSGL